MTRRNLCPNPALSVDATGWTGSSAPTRTAVTGFVRDWAARYAASVTFVETPRGAVTAGLVYTLSVYARLTSVFASVSINSYLSWYKADGSAISFDSLALPDMANGVVTRLVRTGTAPALAATASLIFDGTGSAHTHIDYTAMLTEQASGVDTYADGDTAGWEWDGTAGLSASRESEVVSGLIGRAAGLPAATGSVVVATARSLVGAIE